ncbi:glutathione S-transferase [Rhexocercosporidium sp. MPI-PUGE-AT-0058]|nr:glutathione S-transferase [Rhexocercosporidium sp. MPI-PUGE-AT-0058]
MASSQPFAKRQKTSKEDDTPYELIYWPGLPSRGEHIRLAFEESGTPYTDSAHDPKCMDTHGSLIINQTPNILLYLAPKLGLVPTAEEDEGGVYHVNSLVLTALDGLSNEVHDVHYPVATGLYYKDQKVEAKRKAGDYLENRLQKFLGYFERVLGWDASKGGKWLYGGRLTYADLVLFQCVDGIKHAFPNAMKRIEKEGKFNKVFALYERVKERPNIKEHLASDKRQAYGMGIYRHYPELNEE